LQLKNERDGYVIARSHDASITDKILQLNAAAFNPELVEGLKILKRVHQGDSAQTYRGGGEITR
jgi:hypothetical protein